MAYDAKLDCPECGESFPDFGPLAEHVQRKHSQSPRAAAAHEVTHYFDEAEEEMSRIPSAPRQERAPRTQSSTRMPSAQRTEASSDYNPFLKAEDIGRIGKSATLVLSGNMRGPIRSQFGDQIIVEVKFGRGVFDWGIKLNSPNHRMLEELVGNESTKWRNKKIGVTVLENLGRAYIAIDRPATPANGKAKTRTKTRKQARRR